MRSLEGANCAGLPGFVIDKYFGCQTSREPFNRDVALAICGRCAVLAACRDEAMNGPAPRQGVIAGMTAHEVRIARAWRNFESGNREKPPEGDRPVWLARPESAETVEQTQIETDPDEPPIER